MTERHKWTDPETGIGCYVIDDAIGHTEDLDEGFTGAWVANYDLVCRYAAHLAAKHDECKAAATQDERELRDQIAALKAELAEAQEKERAGLRAVLPGLLKEVEVGGTKEVLMKTVLKRQKEMIDERDAEITALKAELEQRDGDVERLRALRAGDSTF